MRGLLKSELVYPDLWTPCDFACCPSVDFSLGTTLTDFSPFRKTGTLSGDWTVSNGKKALTFGSASTKVVDFGQAVPAKYSTSSTFSVSVWLSPVPSGVIQNIVGCRDNITYGWTLRQNSGQIGILTTGGTSSTYSGSVLAFGVWQHVCLQYNIGAIQIFLNGVSVASATGHTITASPNLYIGNIGVTGSQNCSGLIDDIRITPKLLTPSEISILKLRRGIAYETKRTPGRKTAITITRRKFAWGGF